MAPLMLTVFLALLSLPISSASPIGQAVATSPDAGPATWGVPCGFSGGCPNLMGASTRSRSGVRRSTRSFAVSARKRSLPWLGAFEFGCSGSKERRAVLGSCIQPVVQLPNAGSAHGHTALLAGTDHGSEGYGWTGTELVAQAIGEIGADAAPAVPELVSLLTNPKRVPAIRRASASRASDQWQRTRCRRCEPPSQIRVQMSGGSLSAPLTE